jgi:hypothetical protein
VTYGGANVQGAKVILTDPNCKNNGVSVKREFTTNKAGHIVNSALPAELASTTQAVGLPFGTYEICVSAKINSTEWRRAELTGSNAVKVNNLTTAASASVALAGNNQTRECT